MKKIILGLAALVAAAFTLASPAPVGATGGSGNTTINDVNVTCAAPDNRPPQVTWVTYVTPLERAR